MSDLFSMAGKYVVVTGGTRGIGRAISSRLIRGGASVLANHVRETQAAESFVEKMKSEGLPADVCRADITRSAGIEKLLAAVEKSGNRVSGLVHCAATGVHRPVGELTGRQFDWTFALNVKAYLELVQRLIPMFAERASLVAISSAGAERAARTYALIGSSKGALESLSRHLALELAGKNIRANVVAPGAVLTEAWNILPDREDRLRERIHRAPNHRLTTGEEVAWAVQFLLSDASAGINGQTLVVDGGESIVE